VLKRISLSFLFFTTIVLSLSARDINLNILSADAAKQNKHLLVWLHKTDCGYCEAMREFTLDDDTIKPVLKKSFVFVHINVNEKDVVTHKEFKGDGKAFAKRVGYSFYPSSLFMDQNAEIVFAVPGSIEERDFLVMLNFVRSGAYKKMGYDCYRRQEEKQ
jgi:thioredoxin-related protein